MKKVAAFLLALCMLGLVACGEDPAKEAGKATEAGEAALQVGYARVDITPTEDVAMAIYGSESERISFGFKDQLYGYALAATGSNGETVLILTCDHSWFHASCAEQVRAKLMQSYDLKEENIVCTGTHNHSAPDVGADHPGSSKYSAEFIQAMIKAGKAAMEDRKPATMLSGSAQAENLTFVRRYVLKDGTVPNFQKADPAQIAGHESEADCQLQVLRFVREGEKDIAVYNWQTHVNMNMQLADNYNLLTSDVFGAFCAEMEQRVNANVFMWNGACGNLNPTSQIPEENPTWDHREYGKLLSKFGVEAYENATEVTGSQVQLVTSVYQGEVNHAYDNVVAQASEMLDYYKATGDSKGARAMGEPYGINTEKHAARIISNAKQGPTKEILLKAFCIGDMGFICLRYEMFDSDGMQIKEASPFKQTFIIGYNEASLGYIPSSLVEDHGGYEVDNNVFVMGTGDLLAKEYVKLLEGIHP